MKKIFIPMLMLCLMQCGIMKAEVTDVTTLDNVIYVANAVGEKGGTATLSICMKNNVGIRGFQFDMYLPEGVSVTVSSKGKIQGVKLSEPRLPEDDEHTVTCSVQQDGAIRFLCGSQYDEVFTGTDGEVVTVPVNVSADMAEGVYPIILKNQKLSESDITKSYETAYVESSIDIVPAGIKEINANNQSNTENIYSVSGQRLKKPVRGINIIDGKKVVIK